MLDVDGNDVIAEIADDGEQEREVYARFGLAAYWAQVFERGMMNLIVISELADGSAASTWQSFDSRFDDLAARTAGRLVMLARDGVRLPDADIALCSGAVVARNRLLHHFFWDYAVDFMTTPGRQRMVDDADRCRDLFVRAEGATIRMLHEVGAAVGLTPERIQKMADRMLADALNIDDED